MKIIFSPTKTLKKMENNYESSTPKYLDVTNEIDLNYNVMGDEANQALFYYNGISFKYLDVETLNEDNVKYLNEHLLILSALYGTLRPLDMINNYRLDFTDKTLYNYWKINIADTVLNLASNEYSKMVKCRNVVNVEFKEYKNNKLTTSGTYNKMLRGLLLRYMCVNNITDLALVKEFTELGYVYNDELSLGNTLMFIKGEKVED